MMSSLAVVPSASKRRDSKTDKDKKDEAERLARAKANAIQQALSIEEKKNLQNRVLDMILTAFDLPTHEPADPANPNPDDVKTFRQCLAIFRPSDLDELVSERNIDDRCGYALCRNPNNKQPPKKVWDAKGRLVEKKTDSQWCSRECRDRNNFVKRQLSDEPAWLRQVQNQHILLLMDRAQPQPDVPDVTVTQENENRQKQNELAEERGDVTTEGADGITIVEKEHTKAPKPPRMVDSDVLEGLPIRSIGAVRKENTWRNPEDV